MIIGSLKRDSVYTTSRNNISWRVTRHRLYLTALLKWPECEVLELPPEVVGPCKDWRNVVSPETGSTTFTASWDLRKVRKNSLDGITKNLCEYAII
jgi:hypothetical protein